MVMAGCAAVCEPAFWAGFDRGSAQGFHDYFASSPITSRAAAARYQFAAFLLALHQSQGGRGHRLAREVLAMIPAFLARENVLGIGEIGLNKNTRNELIILEEHVRLAAEHDQMILVHTPHLEDKWKGTRLILDVLRSDARIKARTGNYRPRGGTYPPHGIGRRFLGRHHLYPESKCTPARAVDMFETAGPERLWLNCACDWGQSDPLAVPKAAIEMRRRGYNDATIEKLIFENPRRFLSQSSKFKLRETN